MGGSGFRGHQGRHRIFHQAMRKEWDLSRSRQECVDRGWKGSSWSKWPQKALSRALSLQYRCVQESSNGCTCNVIMGNLSFQADSLLPWVKYKNQESPASLPKPTQSQLPHVQCKAALPVLEGSVLLCRGGYRHCCEFSSTPQSFCCTVHQQRLHSSLM